MSEGPYIELPFLGPSSVRAIPGLVVDSFTNVVNYYPSPERYGLRAADLIDTHAAFARKRPFPWPPEPLRALAVALTQHELARADRNGGRRGPWLGLLDALGLGFDS